jgi:SAM-dependent methyltransferase
MIQGFEYDAQFIPETNDIFVGQQDRELYRLIGIDFLKKFISLCGLKRNWRVLDIGCGSGRLAVPVAWYLTKGTYYGIDIVPAGIQWCVEKIKPCYPNTHFELADIYNAAYHPNGSKKASEFVFPYADNFFDFIFLTSVFTHMQPHDLEHYIDEIHRMLKPRGRCLITFFIYNEEARQGISANKSKFLFTYDYDQYFAVDANLHESAIAYRVEYIKDVLHRHHLKIVGQKNGLWRWHKEYLPGQGQDIVVIAKS